LAQSKGLGGLFACEGSGGKQEGGALIGAAAGALLGNKVAGNEQDPRHPGRRGRRRGGGRLYRLPHAVDRRQHGPTGHQEGAGNRRRRRPGATAAPAQSGRINVVSSSYGPPIDGRNLRYARASRACPAMRPPAAPTRPPDRQPARRSVDQHKVVGKLAAGETFDALGVAPNGGWVLVGRSGYGVGYAAPRWCVRPGGQPPSCRVIDASVAFGGQRASAERYSACKDNRGEWQLTQA
jgi:hypothetical protein